MLRGANTVVPAAAFRPGLEPFCAQKQGGATSRPWPTCACLDATLFGRRGTPGTAGPHGPVRREEAQEVTAARCRRIAGVPHAVFEACSVKPPVDLPAPVPAGASSTAMAGPPPGIGSSRTARSPSGPVTRGRRAGTSRLGPRCIGERFAPLQCHRSLPAHRNASRRAPGWARTRRT